MRTCKLRTPRHRHAIVVIDRSDDDDIGIQIAATCHRRRRHAFTRLVAPQLKGDSNFTKVPHVLKEGGLMAGHSHRRRSATGADFRRIRHGLQLTQPQLGISWVTRKRSAFPNRANDQPGGDPTAYSRRR
jgi:hypothetical protein